jgi:hypothetical protein
MNYRQLFPCLFAVVLAPPIFAADDTAWSNTLERISSGVVSIRVDSTRAFDTEWNSSSQATGFVVDAERGLILTNRHVVTPGPVVAEAVFRNNEEVRLTPVYRDPVHDFGFFRYDPDDLRYIEPAELPLRADGAGIGREIRVIGNDAGEHGLWPRQVQRLQYLLPAGGIGYLGWFVRFTGRQHRRRSRSLERGRQQLGGQQFLPAPGSHREGSFADSERPAGYTRHPADDVPEQGIR